MVIKFKNLKSYEYTRMDDAIFDRYKHGDSYILKEMETLLEDEDELNKMYKRLSDNLKSKEYRHHRRIDEAGFLIDYRNDHWPIINEMISDGIIFKEQDKLIINQAMKDSLQKFVSFLSENDESKWNRYKTITLSTTEQMKATD